MGKVHSRSGIGELDTESSVMVMAAAFFIHEERLKHQQEISRLREVRRTFG